MKRSKKIIALVMAVASMLTLLSGFASAAPAPSLTSVQVRAVGSLSFDGNYVEEMLPSNVYAPSTSFDHHKFAVIVVVEQRGYESWKSARLGTQSPSDVTFEYIVNAANIIIGYRWYYTFMNVSTTASSSLFTFSADNINAPFNTLTTMCTINWV